MGTFPHRREEPWLLLFIWLSFLTASGAFWSRQNAPWKPWSYWTAWVTAHCQRATWFQFPWGMKMKLFLRSVGCVIDTAYSLHFFFFLMLHKVHKSSCFHLFILLLLFIVSLFLFFYWKWKCIWSYLLHTLPRFLPLHEVYVYSTFYAINTSDYTNNRRLSQFARSRI